MRRTSRRIVAAFTLFWLLLFQGAVAAHACKVILDPLGGMVQAASASASSDDCAGMIDNAKAALCPKHCSQGNEASNTASSADFPSLPLAAFVVVDPAPAKTPAVSRVLSRLAAHGTSPPPLLLSQRLRI
jgi:hypothetical protein